MLIKSDVLHDNNVIIHLQTGRQILPCSCSIKELSIPHWLLFLIYHYFTVSIIKDRIGNSWSIVLNYGWQSRTINNVRFRLDCKTKLVYWWLGESPKQLLSAFCPKILGVGGDLWMLFCHSVPAIWVVGTLRDDGNPQTKPTVIEKRAFCTHRWQGCKNILLAPIRARATWWNFH